MLQSTSLASASLARVLEQSGDCIKLVDPNGNMLWMNPNGLCALEIDDFNSFLGVSWASLWPEQFQDTVTGLLETASRLGEAAFSGACPTVKGNDRWWDVSVYPVLDETGDPAGYLSISRDVTQRELDRQTKDTLLEEMRHRIKNSYALVGGLLTTLARGRADREEFAREVQSRIIALSKAQAVFGEDGEQAMLAPLVEAIVAQFHDPELATLKCELPPEVEVDRRTAEAVALTCSEFSVNSTKHGALGKGGQINVSACLEDGNLVLEWNELSRFPVTAPGNIGGQGLGLIRRILAIRGGSLEIEWLAQGLIAKVRFGKS